MSNIIKVEYGDRKGEISFTPHQASLLLVTKFESIEIEDTRLMLLVEPHYGGDKLSENDIKVVDNEITKQVEKVHVYYIMQGENSKWQILTKDTKRFTKPSETHSYILNNYDVYSLPIYWLLLKLLLKFEICKVCEEKNCNISDVLKLAFGDDDDIDTNQFIMQQALRFYHLHGVLLYFESMQELVTTTHQWLFNKLSKIVEFLFVCDTQEEIQDLRKGNACLDISKDFEVSRCDTDSIDTFLQVLEYLQIATPLNQIADYMPCLLNSNDLAVIKLTTVTDGCMVCTYHIL